MPNHMYQEYFVLVVRNSILPQQGFHFQIILIVISDQTFPHTIYMIASIFGKGCIEIF